MARMASTRGERTGNAQMGDGRAALSVGDRSTAHRLIVGHPMHAPCIGDALRSLSALGLALGGIIAAGHGLSAICFLFGVTPDWLLGQVDALGLATPSDRPLRKAAGSNLWTPEQVQQLVQLWPTNLYASYIAQRIGRTPASVRYKAKWLGLARRERASLVRAVPEQQLPLFPPVPPPPVEHRGGRKKAALRVGQDREYTVKEFEETGLRWFAGQHADGIAQDLNRRPKQVSNLAGRIELPPRHSSRNQLTMDYDPKRRLEEFARQEFVLRKCISGGNWFWGTKNGPRTSQATLKSKTRKEKEGGMDEASVAGSGYDD